MFLNKAITTHEDTLVSFALLTRRGHVLNIGPMNWAPKILIRCVMTLLAYFFVLAPGALLAHPEGTGQSTRTARAALSAGKIVIDGDLGDLAWKKAPVHEDLLERKPALNQRPAERTIVRVLYDADALYVGVYCYDSAPDKIRARARGRDSFSLFSDDAISVKIDSGHDHRSTFGFAMNAAGGKLDYRGVNEEQMKVEFDAVWQGQAKIVEDGWTAEFRIPWTVLGIDPSRPPTVLGWNITRDHARHVATYDWNVIIPPFTPIAASRYGHLTGFEDLKKLYADGASASGAVARPLRPEWVWIPYGIAGADRSDGTTSLSPKAGLDGSVRWAGRWRAHWTLNTDFAQVDVDDQVINLTRYPLFLPDKRTFFQDDLEIFAFGRPGEVQPFHSRRIGLEGSEVIPIAGGVKFVGDVRDDVHLGFINVTTRPSSKTPWTNHSVARLQHELDGGSNVGMMMTHRQSLENRDEHNVVLGLDAQLRPANSRLLVRMFSLSSWDKREDEALNGAGRFDGGFGFDVGWRGTLVRPSLSYSYLGEDLSMDLGFVRRVGVHKNQASLVIEPRTRWGGLEKITMGTDADAVLSSKQGALLDWSFGQSVNFRFRNGYSVGVAGRYVRELLERDVTLDTGTKIEAGTFAMRSVEISGGTSATRTVSTDIGLRLSDYYGGTLMEGHTALRFKPKGRVHLEVGALVSQAEFQDPTNDFFSAVINGRCTLGFSPTLGLDLYGGWNRIYDRVLAQARLRWTYAAGSDIFVVYQNNLEDDDWTSVFQSLIVKVTYRWP